MTEAKLGLARVVLGNHCSQHRSSLPELPLCVTINSEQVSGSLLVVQIVYLQMDRPEAKSQHLWAGKLPPMPAVTMVH